MKPILNKRETEQLRRTIALLSKIREHRTRDPDDEDDPTYHAALAEYHLDDFLRAVTRDFEDRVFHAQLRAIENL